MAQNGPKKKQKLNDSSAVKMSTKYTGKHEDGADKNEQLINKMKVKRYLGIGNIFWWSYNFDVFKIFSKIGFCEW